MSDKRSEDRDGQPETCWDISIRALIRGNVHHKADGASLHGGDSKRQDPAQPGEAGSMERPSGEDMAKRRRQIRGVASGRKRRKASGGDVKPGRSRTIVPPTSHAHVAASMLGDRLGTPNERSSIPSHRSPLLQSARERRLYVKRASNSVCG